MVNLAVVIYRALDYMHSEDEERLISPDLEGLITEMTSCDAVGELFVDQTLHWISNLAYCLICNSIVWIVILLL